MALESAFDLLGAALGRLHDVLDRDARVIVVEDRPWPKAEPVDRLCDAFVDVLGWLEGARQSAEAAGRAAAHPGDMYRARRALAECHEHVARLSAVVTSELTSWERVAVVRRCCAEHGTEWRAWWKEASRSIAECREPIADVERSLLTCWQELAERLGAGAMTVHAQLGHTVTVHPVSQESER